MPDVSQHEVSYFIRARNGVRFGVESSVELVDGDGSIGDGCFSTGSGNGSGSLGVEVTLLPLRSRR